MTRYIVLSHVDPPFTKHKKRVASLATQISLKR